MRLARSLPFGALLFAACATTAPASREEVAAVPAVEAPQPIPVAWSPSPPPGPLAAPVTKEPVRHERALANGLRIVVIEHHHRPLVRLRLVFPSGAAAEGDSVAGVTNMSLSLLCDRIEKRDAEDELIVSDEKSARRSVVDVGGSLGSFVASETSGLGIDGYAADTLAYLRTMYDIIQTRRHGIDGFTSRRDALLDAIDDLELGDSVTLNERLFELAFGKRHPYARRGIGTKASLAAMGMEDVIDVQNKLLHPQGAVLLVVGDVHGPAILAGAAQIFAPWSTRGKLLESPELVAPVVTQRTSVVVVPRWPARTTALCAARPLTDTKASNGAVAVLAEVLGTYRLTDALREGPGLTYSASAGIVRRRSARALMMCTRLPTKDTSEGLRIFLNTLEKFRETPVAAVEVDRAKAVIASQLLGGHDTIASSIQTWLSALDLQEAPSIADQVAEVRAVTTEQVRTLADTVLRLDSLQFVLSGDSLKISEAIKINKLGKAVTLWSAHE